MRSVTVSHQILYNKHIHIIGNPPFDCYFLFTKESVKKLFGIWEKGNVFPLEDLRRMRDIFDRRTSRGASILDNRPPSSPTQGHGSSVRHREGLPSFLTAVPAPTQNLSYQDQQKQQPISYYNQQGHPSPPLPPPPYPDYPSNSFPVHIEEELSHWPLTTNVFIYFREIHTTTKQSTCG